VSGIREKIELNYRDSRVFVQKAMESALRLLRNPWVARVYVVAIVGFAGAYLYGEQVALGDALKTMDLRVFFLVIPIYLCMEGLLITYMYYWVLHWLGAHPSFTQTFGMYQLPRIGQYLPGRFWSISGFYLLSRQFGLERGQIIRTLFLVNMGGIIAGILASVPVFYLFRPTIRVGGVLLFAVAVLTLHPTVQAWIGRVVAPDTEVPSLPLRFYGSLIALYIIVYALLGAQLYLVAGAFTSVPREWVMFFFGIYPAAALVGFLTLFAPSGIGVREGVGIFLLSHALPIQIAALIMITLRAIAVLGDSVCGLFALLWWRKQHLPHWTPHKTMCKVSDLANAPPRLN